MEQPAGTVAAKAAVALREAARSHHRAANQHKRRARVLMEKFDEVKRECARLGIEIPLDPPNAPQGVTGER